MFASPVKTFKQVIKHKSTNNCDALPYITTLLSSSLGILYGLIKPRALLILTVNGVGAASHITYVILFLIYSPSNTKLRLLKLVGTINVVFLGVVVFLTLVVIKVKTDRINLVGFLCAGLTIAMHAAPLSSLKSMIKKRSVKYMPLLLTFFQFLDGGVWFAYALLAKDLYIGVPNGIGMLLSVAQLIVYMAYRNKTRPETTLAEIITGTSEKIEEFQEANLEGTSGVVKEDQEVNLQGTSEKIEEFQQVNLEGTSGVIKEYQEVNLQGTSEIIEEYQEGERRNGNKETCISLSNVVAERDEMIRAFNQEREKMQQNEIV